MLGAAACLHAIVVPVHVAKKPRNPLGSISLWARSQPVAYEANGLDSDVVSRAFLCWWDAWFDVHERPFPRVLELQPFFHGHRGRKCGCESVF